MDTFISVQSLGDSLNIEKEDIERELGDVREVSQYVQELGATRKYLENIVRRMIRLREQASGRRYSEIIEKARDYIGQNYMSENISLNLVAASVNISPSYFSSLFSQEVGSTFVEYLTGVRMEKAKELLMCSDKRTSDIGYEVGYKDSHYFSYIFKKTQGCSPKEFRSRGRG
ncbi:helix-turn-helix domain-containing protein [Coprococcus comes]|nr:helix-turn-helix domain-containing protein [Coprococcus comes]